MTFGRLYRFRRILNARRLAWAALTTAFVVMISYGSLAAGGELTDAERALAVAQSLRCPQCSGESVAESNVTAAREMRADISRRISDGQSGDDIRAVYAARYGEAILLTPPARGLASLVWIIPVVAGALAAAALTLAFKLKRGETSRKTSEASPEAGAASTSSPRRRGLTLRRALAILLVAAMLSGGTGFVLASALGTRTSSDAATGDIRQSVRGKLFTARELMVAGSYEEADAVYAEILSSEPANAEALAWRGWGQFLAGNLPTAAETLAAAVLSDPDDPAARVFAAVVAERRGSYEEAAEHLGVLDTLEAPPEVTVLVEGSNLHSEVRNGLSQALAERLADNEPTDSDDWTAFDALAATAETQVLSLAAWRLDSQGRAVAAARLYQLVLQSDPDNLTALLGRGVQLTSEGFMKFEELFNEGVKALDRLVELAPQDPESRYWRALAAYRQGRLPDAQADLDVLDDLEPEPPEALGEAVQELRERIAAEKRRNE